MGQLKITFSSRWYRFGFMLGSLLLDHVGIMLGSFWDQLLVTLGWCWNHLGISVEWRWKPVGIILEPLLGYISDHVGIILASFRDMLWSKMNRLGGTIETYTSRAIPTRPQEVTCGCNSSRNFDVSPDDHRHGGEIRPQGNWVFSLRYVRFEVLL